MLFMMFIGPVEYLVQEFFLCTYQYQCNYRTAARLCSVAYSDMMQYSKKSFLQKSCGSQLCNLKN